MTDSGATDAIDGVAAAERLPSVAATSIVRSRSALRRTASLLVAAGCSMIVSSTEAALSTFSAVCSAGVDLTSPV